jgi:hypothetical protein
MKGILMPLWGWGCGMKIPHLDWILLHVVELMRVLVALYRVADVVSFAGQADRLIRIHSPPFEAAHYCVDC